MGLLTNPASVVDPVAVVAGRPGLLSDLGYSSPLTDFLAQHRGVLTQFGAGLASGQNISQGLSNAAQGVASGAASDSAYGLSLADQQSRLDQIAYDRTLQQNALALAANQRNQTADWVTKIGHPELADAVRSGAITGSDVFAALTKPGTSVRGGDTYVPNSFTMGATPDAAPPAPNAPAAPAPQDASGGPVDPSTAPQPLPQVVSGSDVAPIGSLANASQLSPAVPPPTPTPTILPQQPVQAAAPGPAIGAVPAVAPGLPRGSFTTPARPTTVQENYNTAVSQGFKGSLVDYQKSIKTASTTADIQNYALYAQQTKAAGQVPMSFLDYKQSSSAGGSAGTEKQAEQIGDAIISGRQPSTTTGLYRIAGPLRAYLASKNYDYTKANEDWTATQKLLGTMNGAQQTRLRQATDMASDSLGVIDKLAQQWKAGGFPLVNSVIKNAAQQGITGHPEAQSLATQLDTEIADLTGELGNVYMGGNSPTEKALELAGKQLSSDWSEDTLRNAIQLARVNLAYRRNSLLLGPAGIQDSQYTQMPSQAAPDVQVGPAGVTQAPATGAAPAGYKIISVQ